MTIVVPNDHSLEHTLLVAPNLHSLCQAHTNIQLGACRQTRCLMEPNFSSLNQFSQSSTSDRTFLIPYSQTMASTQPATPDIDTSAERQASGKGHGTLEILEIIKAFNKADIASCIVGVSALMYFGARRVRDVSYNAFFCDPQQLNPV